MARPAQFESDAVSEVKGLIVFEAPGQIIDDSLNLLDLGTLHAEGHRILQHRSQEGLGGVGRDDLPLKSLVYELRQASDVVDVGMGEKEEIDLARRDRPLSDGDQRIVPLWQSAVH